MFFVEAELQNRQHSNAVRMLLSVTNLLLTLLDTRQSQTRVKQ
ncbi:hypothetical protein T10_57 [Trichinella papuae]|uniref:Uncharacterized protein n=1 Tax=Trichinella papuae TaxID=268474 RepID=A0A0V1LZW6_9BILA|nr:hypothetical protein T10_57 [Trichinella papuae]